MNFNNVEFLISAASSRDFPADRLPEIAFAGKSNVGKSSVINRILQRKNFARVGEKPGKTVHVNYFTVDNQCYFVDLPGYGYAKLSKSATENWGAMMETYFQNRQGLKKVIQLVDIRHKPSAQDVQMYEYLRHYGLDGIVVCTKADKVSRNEAAKNIAMIRKTLDLSKDDKVIAISALKRTGYEELLDVIEGLLEE